MKETLISLAFVLILFCISCKKEINNSPPIINKIELDSTTIIPGGIVNVQVFASDPDGDQMNYTYTVSKGSISGIGQNVQIIAPIESGLYNLNVVVSDGKGGEATGYEVFYVNSRPIIIKIDISPEELQINSTATIKVDAIDPDEDHLIYNYFPEAGIILGSGSFVTWNAPNYFGSFKIEIQVSDGKDTVKAERTLVVVNFPPIITSVIVNPNFISPGEQVNIYVVASDPDGDILNYSYSTNGGSIYGSGVSVNWEAPLSEGQYFVNVIVSDGNGGADTSKAYLNVTNESGEIEFWSGRIVGSWNNPTGSAFASLNGNVYPLFEAFQNQALIDLLYWWSSIYSATIGAPDDGNAAQVFNTGDYKLDNWIIKNSTRFKTTEIGSSDFYAISFASEIIDIATGADQSRISGINSNEVIAFETVTNKHGLILITSILPGSDGTIHMDVKIER